jgi:hypothetical protein
MLFKEIIAAYNDNKIEFINTKFSVTNCESKWHIYLPLGFKELNVLLQQLVSDTVFISKTYILSKSYTANSVCEICT